MIYLIIILSVILRLVKLNQSLWLDEATQAVLSKDSLNNIIFRHGADFHPPLSYILMHFWIMFNPSETWLRLLSVIFGILSVLVLYKIASKIFNENIALVSAFFMAVSPYHVYYSQEVRMYSELVFFALLSMYFFYCLLKEKRLKDSIRYVLSSAALIYTHYDGFFLLAAQAVYLSVTSKENIKKFWKYLLAIFILWTPWIPQFLVQLRGGLNIDQYLPGWRQILTLSFYKSLPETLLKFSLGRVSLGGNFLAAFSILLVVLFLLFKGARNYQDKKIELILSWFLTPLALAWLFSFKIPLNQPFRLLYILPAFYMLLSLGLKNLTSLRIFFFLIILMISISGLLSYYTNPANQREDWRGASLAVAKDLSPNSIVIFAWPQPFPPYEWYANNLQAMGVVKTFPASQIQVEENTKNLNKKNDIYFFEYLQSLSDPNKYIQQILTKKGFKLDKVYNFNGVGFVDHYK